MRSSYSSAVLVLHGNSDDLVVKRASEILDQSGLSYVTRAARGGAAKAGEVRVSWGEDSVSNFTRRELVEFLWAHGAKFEDS